MKRIHLFIFGNVQGVSFRYFTKQKADELDIHGWVKNLSDGRVEAVFEGEEKSLDKILAWIIMGPENARVEGIEKQEEKAEGLNGFEILI